MAGGPAQLQSERDGEGRHGCQEQLDSPSPRACPPVEDRGPYPLGTSLPPESVQGPQMSENLQRPVSSCGLCGLGQGFNLSAFSPVKWTGCLGARSK